MSERERWIVYPLLFLAIAASLKDKFVPSDIRAGTIECNELQCRTKITSAQVTSLTLACQKSVIADLQSRQLAIIDTEKQPRIILNTSGNDKQDEDNANHDAGIISVLDSEGKPVCSVGRVLLCDRLLVAGRADMARLVANVVGVADETGEPRVVLSAKPVEQDDDQDGDTKSRPGSGRLELLGPDGQVAVALGTSSDGGYIAATHDERQAHILLSHSDAGSGLFFLGAEGASHAMSTVEPGVIEAQPVREPPAETPPDDAAKTEEGEAEAEPQENTEEDKAKADDEATDPDEAANGAP